MLHRVKLELKLIQVLKSLLYLNYNFREKKYRKIYVFKPFKSR